MDLKTWDLNSFKFWVSNHKLLTSIILVLIFVLFVYLDYIRYNYMIYLEQKEIFMNSLGNDTIHTAHDLENENVSCSTEIVDGYKTVITCNPI